MHRAPGRTIKAKILQSVLGPYKDSQRLETAASRRENRGFGEWAWDPKFGVEDVFSGTEEETVYLGQ